VSGFDPPQDPGTPQEISRRTFLANATVVLGGLVGLGVAIPVIASTVPTKELLTGSKQWYPLDENEFKQLEASTDKPIKIFFQHKVADGYITSTNPEYVWGIKLAPGEESKLRSSRPDLFAAKDGEVPYPVVNMGFVMFSPICPHLGCHYNWDDTAGKFVCPCHGSVYTKLGEHIGGPAPRGLDPLPFREASGVAEITWIDFLSIIPARIIVSYS